MKKHFIQILTICTFAFVPLAATAEDDDGLTLMERGAQLFLEGILKEVEPAMRDLQELGENMEPALKEFVGNMGPALAELLEQVEDWSAYDPPEVLPNGDIILRKKLPQTAPLDEGEIEL